MTTHTEVATRSEWYQVAWKENGQDRKQEFRSRIEAQQQFNRLRNAGVTAVMGPLSIFRR